MLSVAISWHEKGGNWRSDLHSKYFKSFHSWGVGSIGWRRASTEVERNDENLLDRLHAWVKLMGSFRSQQQPTNAAVVCADAHSPPNRFPKWDFFSEKKTKTLSGPVCSRSTGLWNVFRYISVPYHRHIEKIKNKKFFRSINCRYISKREPRSFNRRLPLVPNFDSTLSSTSFLFPSMIRYFYFFWDFWRLVPDSHLTAGVTLPLLLSYFHFLFCFVLFSRLHTPVHHHDHQWSFVSFRNWWTAIFFKNIYRTQNTTRWTVLLIKERKWLKGFFVSDTIWKIVCVPPSSGAHVRARKLNF